MISFSTKVFETYQSLLVEPSFLTNDRMFVVSTLPDRSADFVGKDSRYRPVILIKLPRDTSATVAPPLVLEHLRVDHQLQCRLIGTNGSSDEGEYCVIRCIEDDSAMHFQFLRIIATVVESLVPYPSQRELHDALERAIELFRLLSSPARKTIQGLWAELLLIERSRNPCVLLESWHQLPEDLYDFALGRERIEVKSTTNPIRRHHFSLSQLSPPPGTAVIVASVLLEISQDGLGVNDLVDAIALHVGNRRELINRLTHVALATLGGGWREATNVKFNYAKARASLRYYNSSAIPSVSIPLDSAVSDVHFSADLSNAQELGPLGMAQRGPLFQGML